MGKVRFIAKLPWTDKWVLEAMWSGLSGSTALEPPPLMRDEKHRLLTTPPPFHSSSIWEEPEARNGYPRWNISSIHGNVRKIEKVRPLKQTSALQKWRLVFNTTAFNAIAVPRHFSGGSARSWVPCIQWDSRYSGQRSHHVISSCHFAPPPNLLHSCAANYPQFEANY